MNHLESALLARFEANWKCFASTFLGNQTPSKRNELLASTTPPYYNNIVIAEE